MKTSMPVNVVVKMAMTHTTTYFVVGLIASTLFNYSGRYADPTVASLMRQTTSPLVASGPLFQVLRGALFGIAFYPLRDIVLARKTGWLVMWLVLLIVGIVSPFGAAPSSIEGMIYTNLPTWFHGMGLPEVVIQSLLLAWLSHYWINHADKRWLSAVIGIAFVVVLLLSTLGVLAALGILSAPTR